jgi:hypothetical protein
VGTVDSFQGQERGISAITLTRSNPQGEIGFLPDIRRRNVGMTRARRKLLLVGDSSTLCRHPFFGALLAYVTGVGGIGQRRRWVNKLESVMATVSSYLHKPGYCVHCDPQNGFGCKGKTWKLLKWAFGNFVPVWPNTLRPARRSL